MDSRTSSSNLYILYRCLNGIEQSVEPWKGAHVVGHYADVARLVGLTENELYTQLKNIKQHANLSKFLLENFKPNPNPIFR